MQPDPSSPADSALIEARLDQAFDAYEQGRLDLAAEAFQSVLALSPQEFDALHMLGVMATQQRDLPRAIDLLRRAVASDPEAGMAHTNLGVALVEAGQPELALASLDRGVALEPSPQAHFSRGVAQLALQQHEAAAQSFAAVVAQQPTHVEAHFNRGSALMALQRWDEALASLGQVLQLHPRHVSALVNRGQVHAALGHGLEALADHDQAIAIEPGRAAAWSARGEALHALGRDDDALRSFDKAISLQPDRWRTWLARGHACLALGRAQDALMGCDKALALLPSVPPSPSPWRAEVLAGRGHALARLGRLPEAVASYRQALALVPDDAVVLANLSGVLRDLGQLDEALACADRAVALDAQLPGAHTNRGNALQDMGRPAEASASFAQALSLRPDDLDLQWALGWSHLLTGHWAEGLPLFEVRWQRPSFPAVRRGFTQPLWLGDADLQGRTILLHAEQGLGDTLQFCRYAPLVAARGARVVLEVQPPLKGLMASLAGVDQVLAAGEPLPAFDCHCPLMSLPLAWRSTPDTVPAAPSYLQAPAAALAEVAQRLGARSRPRIGLVWSGNAAHRNDANRSLPLSLLLSALPEGPQYVCLQRDVRDEDLRTLQSRPDILRFEDVAQTFEGTAALTTLMDLVISVDTSLAHLAGALGCPTWVLLPAMSDWRWLTQRSDSPWYPKARLYRQATWGQWSAPLQALHDDLASWLREAAASA